ncbi:MAG: hypothetical protein B6D64_13330 [Bacteroidetes bacterium 4484_276]|nr:MAG: hypothetical protein B6D64_13330 [Bacteroidetes bacterium 4484_276]
MRCQFSKKATIPKLALLPFFFIHSRETEVIRLLVSWGIGFVPRLGKWIRFFDVSWWFCDMVGEKDMI